MTEWYEYDPLAEHDPIPLTTVTGLKLVRQTEEYLMEVSIPEPPVYRKLAQFIIDGFAAPGNIFFTYNPFRKDK